MASGSFDQGSTPPNAGRHAPGLLDPPGMWLFSWLVAALPLDLSLWLGRRVAGFWYWCLPIRMGVARRNLRRVFGPQSRGEERRILRGCLDNLAMTAIELLRSPHLSGPELCALVTVEGGEHRDLALGLGRGMVAIATHLGNLDMVAQAEAHAGICQPSGLS